METEEPFQQKAWEQLNIHRQNMNRDLMPYAKINPSSIINLNKNYKSFRSKREIFSEPRAQ